MLENKERKRCILHNLNEIDNTYLSLTEDQINFFKWLCKENFICSDDYDLEIVEDDISWKEI